MRRVLIAGNIKENDVLESLRFFARVRAAGGIGAAAAVIDEAEAAAYADDFDALILTGGADMPPNKYGQESHVANTYDSSARELSDELLFRAFRKAGKRIMGICRGCQAINVYLGGTLHQHLPDAYEPVLWHARNIRGRHWVQVEAGSRLASLLGSGELRVNSSHHQAIDRLGGNLSVCAVAPDGVIEAAEGDGLFLIQWHPEYMDDEHDALFSWLIES
jgi:putative glutamine amidotransferase